MEGDCWEWCVLNGRQLLNGVMGLIVESGVSCICMGADYWWRISWFLRKDPVWQVVLERGTFCIVGDHWGCMSCVRGDSCEWCVLYGSWLLRGNVLYRSRLLTGCPHLASGGCDADRLGDCATKLQIEVFKGGLAIAAGVNTGCKLAQCWPFLCCHLSHIACSNAHTTCIRESLSHSVAKSNNLNTLGGYKV